MGRSIGPNIQSVLSSLNLTTITIPAGETIYSQAFSLKEGEYFALAYKAGSSGAVDLTIDLQQSHKLPTTEGADDAAYVVPESASAVHSNLADTDWHSESLSPVAMPYARLMIASAAGVANTLQAKLSKQESL